MESAFDNRKDGVLLLQLEERQAQLPEKLASRRLKQIQVAGIINMVAEGAFGVGDAMDMAENIGGNGRGSL